jgi:hypothetical protein
MRREHHPLAQTGIQYGETPVGLPLNGVGRVASSASATVAA